MCRRLAEMAQDQNEGELFLQKLQVIWKMKVTGSILSRNKRALEFLGRTVCGSKDSELASNFVSRGASLLRQEQHYASVELSRSFEKSLSRAQNSVIAGF